MMKNRFTLMLLIFSLFGLTLSACASENCALAAPPRAAGLNTTHGYFLFIFPRQINARYTGCQTMWDETGAPLIILKFEQGTLVSLQQFSSPPSKAAMTCRYDTKSNISLDKDCPARKDFETGFLTVPVTTEPIVPEERDPRKD